MNRDELTKKHRQMKDLYFNGPGKIRIRLKAYADWFLELSDEEKDHLEKYDFVAISGYDDKRILTDRKRREVDRERRERDEFLAGLKKQLRPSGRGQRLKFQSWCRKNGMKFKEPTLDSDSFKKFKQELEENYKQACRRADILIDLIFIRIPMPTGSESAYDCFYNEAWNRCIGYAIYFGKIPPEVENKGKVPYQEIEQKAWNDARKKLAKKKYKEVFK